MTLSRICRLLVASVAIFFSFPAKGQADPPQIWFGPVDWFDRPITNVKGSPDFMAALQSDSTMSRINAFEIADILVKWASDDDFRYIFSFFSYVTLHLR